MGSGDLSTGSVAASWPLLLKRWPGCWSAARHVPPPHPRHLGARAAQGGSSGPKAGRWALGRVDTWGTGGCTPSVPNRPAGVSSSHRSRPCLPPSVHSERLSLANPGAFRDRSLLLPPSLPPRSSQGVLSLRFVSLLCPGHPASLPWPAGWVTPSLLGTWCPQVRWFSTLSPAGGAGLTGRTSLLGLHRPRIF